MILPSDLLQPVELTFTNIAITIVCWEGRWLADGAGYTARIGLGVRQNHPVNIVWDNPNTREDDEVEAVLRAAAGHLILLYLLTYSP